MSSAINTREEMNRIHWFVMRAYKCEQAAEDMLRGRDGLECFMPKHYVLRVYHGVKSKRLVPVIPSLVFVHASHRQITEFKKTYNPLQFVTTGMYGEQKYLIVPDKQMDDFIRVASQYEESMLYLRPDEVDIEKGTRVRIHGGKFDGVEGVFMRVSGKRNRRLVVLLEGILAISAEVQPDMIEVIR